MSAALQTAAAALIAARHALIDAQLKHNQALAAANAAEAELIEAYQNDDNDDVGAAVVCNGYALVLVEEYWEVAAGQKIQMHKIMGAAS